MLGTGKPGERMALASNIDHTVDGRAGDRFDFMNVAVEVAHGNGPARSVRGEPPIACAPWAGPGFAVGGDGSRLQHAVVGGKLRLVEEARGDAAGSKLGTVDQPAVETAIGDDATEEEPVETVAKTGDGRLPRRGVHDQLGDHRVVVRRDRGAELDRGVPPNRVRNVEHGDLPDLRRKVVGGIFGVDAHLDRVAGEGHRVLRDAERE